MSDFFREVNQQELRMRLVVHSIITLKRDDELDGRRAITFENGMILKPEDGTSSPIGWWRNLPEVGEEIWVAVQSARLVPR